MASYLDKQGLAYLWSKIKAEFATKQLATANNAGLMSPQDKIKLDSISQDGVAHLDCEVDEQTLVFTKK